MRDPRLAPYRAPALVFAAYLLVQAVSSAALFLLKLGAGPDGVRAFYLGSAERFTAAKSLGGMLEVAVPHLVAIPLVLFAVVHVVGFARMLPQRVFGALVALSFGTALMGALSGFGVRWISPALAWVKIAAFAGLEISLLSWAALLVVLFIPWPQALPASVSAGPAAEEATR